MYGPPETVYGTMIDARERTWKVYGTGQSLWLERDGAKYQLTPFDCAMLARIFELAARDTGALR